MGYLSSQSGTFPIIKYLKILVWFSDEYGAWSKMNNKLLVLKGVAWSGIQMVISQFFSFAVKLMLAGILLPGEFGIVGMALVFTGLIQVITDLGISAMLVQRKAETLREDHFHTAFWTSAGWSIMLYVVMVFLVTPFATSFYNEPALASLIPVMSISILLTPANAISKAHLTKSMNFKRIAFVENFASGLAGVFSLVLAYLGYGVWALALQAVLTTAFASTIYVLTSSWRPKFVWKNDSFHDIFGFGAYTTGTNIINYLINNFDYFLIGKMVSASALGAYTFAFVVTDTFRSKLMSIINNVMYPMYGRMQDDKVALKKYYLKVLQYNSVIVFPIMVVIIICANDITHLFFGNKWDDSLLPMKILSLSVMVHMMVNSNTALIRGLGKPDLEMKLQLLKVAIFLPLLWIGISQFGIVGAAISVLIHKIIAVIIAQYTFKRFLNLEISTSTFIKAISVPWLASVTSVLLVFAYRYLIPQSLWVDIIIIVVSYFGVVTLFLGNEIMNSISEIRGSIREIRKSKP